MTRQQQREHALRIANEQRSRLAAVAHDLMGLSNTAGRQRLAAMLERHDQITEAAPLERLLAMPRKVGHVQITGWLRAAGVTLGNRAGRELTPRQRAILVECLRGTLRPRPAPERVLAAVLRAVDAHQQDRLAQATEADHRLWRVCDRIASVG